MRQNIYVDNICTTTGNKAQEYATEHMDIMYGMNQEEDENQILIPIKPLEEQFLSQKMNQLSTKATTTNEKESLLKNNVKVEIEKIPIYLTKRNQSFKQMLYETLSTMKTTATKDNMEELRKIAILIYKIMFIQNYQALWMTYLKSGTGQLLLINQSQEQKLMYPTNLPIWPKEMKAIIQQQSSTKKDKKTINENEICMTFVNNSLHELDTELKKYQIELSIKINHFNGSYTITIQKRIEKYIEENLSSLRMEIEHKIQLVHYDYHIRALKLEYLRHNPNQYQEQLMNEVCQSKYIQELAEQEYHLLKQQITYYNSPSQSFDSSSIAHSLLNDLSIQDKQMQQEYYQKCKALAEECRTNLFAMYMQAAEDQREEYKKKYEANVKKIFSSKHPSLNNDKEKQLSQIMIQLIDQRCQKISERIKCIYKFKAQSFL